MARGFAGYNTAARATKAMRIVAENAINRQRPAPAYATVETIDTTNRRCTVRYLDTTDPTLAAVPVSMGSISPARPGQVVRIEGVLGDRYIADVLGEVVVAGGGHDIGECFLWAGSVIPTYALAADGRLLSTSTYPAAFQALQYRHGGSGSTFAIPSLSSTDTNLVWCIRVL